MDVQKDKWRRRHRRHLRIRRKVRGTAERPRLAVCRSHRHIGCQIIDDDLGRTLGAASSLSPEIRQEVAYGGNVEAAKVVGAKIAEKAKSSGIARVVFDRGPYKFHGRVKALADSAREQGLDF